MKYRISAFLFALLLVSCATKLPYSFNYPLTEQTFFSRDGTFFGLVPQGWFASSVDTLAPALLVWLVKEDFSAVLTVRELHMDRLSTKRIQKDGLQLLANISMAAHEGESSKPPSGHSPAEYSMKGKTYCSYEVSENNVQKRIVVFSGKGKYFECEAIPIKGNWFPENVTELFTAQQAMLASLIF